MSHPNHTPCFPRLALPHPRAPPAPPRPAAGGAPQPSLPAVNQRRYILTLSPPSHSPDLAQNQYFEDPAFVRYLEYLQYWRAPPIVLVLVLR